MSSYPKSVAEGGLLESIYLLYSQLSSDAANTSLTALCRYLVLEEGTGMRGIDVCPVPRLGEMTLTVYQACIALTGACVAFNQIVGPTIAARALIPMADAFEAVKAATSMV